VTRLRGCYFDEGWDVNYDWGLNNSIAFDLGRNDLLILDNCFAFQYKCWIHFYDDPAHGPTPSASWAQIRGGGADQCGVCVWVEQVQAQGIDIDGVHLSSTTGWAPAPNLMFQIDGTNTGSVRIHNCMMVEDFGTFGTVAGSGEATVDNCVFIGDAASMTPPTFATTAVAVTGTGRFALRNCVFRTIQTHVSLGGSLVRAVLTGNMATGGTFTFSNGIGTNAMIASNSGSDTVYVGTDMRLVAVSGGAKLEARNTATGVWVEAARWTNP
jgi:hypothetical protein